MTDSNPGGFSRRSWARRVAWTALTAALVMIGGPLSPARAEVDSPVLPFANLRPTEIVVDDSAAVVGEKIFFDSGIVNAGRVGTSKFTVEWFVDGEEVGAYETHAGIPAGQTVMDGNSQFTWAFEKPGSHAVSFHVDVDNDVPESIEWDNAVKVEVQVEPTLANLRPTAIVLDKSALVVGRTIFFDSGIENAGGTDTGEFNVRWLVDGQDVGAYGRHKGVPAGKTILDGNSQFSWVFDRPGWHTVTFVVDVDNYVLESEEYDNATRVSLDVKPSAANLRPTEIVVDPPVTLLGEKVLFDSGIENAGGADTGKFTIRWFVDGQDVGYNATHQGVPAGTTILDGESLFTWVFDTPGWHKVAFLVDVDNNIAESDETDNATAVEVYCQPVEDKVG